MIDQFIYVHFYSFNFSSAVQLFSVTQGTFSSQARHKSRCLCRQVRTFGTMPPDAANRPKIQNIKSTFLYASICCKLSDMQPPPLPRTPSPTPSPLPQPAVKSPTFMWIPLRSSECPTVVGQQVNDEMEVNEQEVPVAVSRDLLGNN
jgi:hypothetical protein